MKVYTKTGDDGTTQLIGGDRVLKSSPRIDAYGEIDELNSIVGLLVSSSENSEVNELLQRVQSLLFSVGSALADPNNSLKFDAGEKLQVEFLEKDIDKMEEALDPLKNFILPGGTLGASFAHLARTTCRRCERAVVCLSNDEGAQVLEIIKFLNRLSDYFFVLARYLNKTNGKQDIIWQGN